MKKLYWLILSFFLYQSLSAQSDTVKQFPNGNILLRKNAKMQLMSSSGQELGSWTETMHNNKQGGRLVSIVSRTDSLGKRKSGVFDQLNGEFVLPLEYDQLSPTDYGKGYYATRIGKKYGFFIVSTGKILPPVYDFAGRHLNPGWFIMCTSACGYVFDEELRVVDSIPGMKSIHSRITSGNKQWMHINMTGWQGLLDQQNKLIYRKEWTHVYDVMGTVAIANSEKGIGLFDLSTGKMVKPYSYSDYWPDLFGGQGFLQKGNKWLLINKNGKMLFEFTADDIRVSMQEETGGFYYKKKGLWGVMNNKGKIIRTPVWESVSPGTSGGFIAKYPGQPDTYYHGIYKDINGEKVLMGIRQLTPDQIDVAYPDQAKWVREEPKEVIEIRNLPGDTRPVEDEDKVLVKMEVDPTFAKPGENEKTILRQFVEVYKKEHTVKASGTVQLKLVVEKDGKISRSEIITSPDPVLSEASKELLKTIKGWKPGIQNGRPVRGEKILVLEW